MLEVKSGVYGQGGGEGRIEMTKSFVSKRIEGEGR